jgi:hypothetical protein
LGAAPGESNSTEESDTILRLRPARMCLDELQTLHLDAASGNGSFYLHDVEEAPPVAFKRADYYFVADKPLFHHVWVN